ncbi:MAG: hypothetical protein KTR31_11350 [Myxococcales bacterium]|nr:hypothetical protein [Myxococcales bacterium]
MVTTNDVPLAPARRAGSYLWSVLIGFALGCSGAQPSTESPPPADTPTDSATMPPATRADRFVEELAARGLAIRVGAAAELDPSDCCQWETCYLFNPDNRYIGWWLPPGPGQAVVNPILDDAGRSLAWRLRADEAVVAFGTTPPSARYFSYRSYLHDRWFDDRTARDWVFENLGDSRNQLAMSTASDEPFGSDFLLTTTAHAATLQLVQEAAEAAGFDPSSFNVDVIAGADLRMGLHSEADTFRMQHRMALFDDEQAASTYLAEPPVTVWRVTPLEPLSAQPLDPPPLRSRGTGSTEEPWAGALQALETAILEAHGGKDPGAYVAHPLNVSASAASELDCAPGCNRDTFFAITQDFILPIWADAFAVVYGVNHERTGKSVYSNFSVVGVEQLSSYAAVNSQQMVGSASVYLPDEPLADDLYAWRIARDCTGDPYCMELPDECPGLASLEHGAIAYRAYTEPQTTTGPLASELLVDRAIVFTRPLAK